VAKTLATNVSPCRYSRVSVFNPLGLACSWLLSLFQFTCHCASVTSVTEAVRHPSIDDTVGGETWLRLWHWKYMYSVFWRPAVNPCQAWYEMRCCLKGPKTTKLPSPCSTCRSFNCTLIRLWKLISPTHNSVTSRSSWSLGHGYVARRCSSTFYRSKCWSAVPKIFQ